MDFENKIVTVNLVFLDSRSLKWGSKEYIYYMSEELYNKVFNTLYDKEFSIVNVKGYNYRNTTLKMVSSSLVNEQDTIKDLKERLVEIKEVIYDKMIHKNFLRKNSDKIYIPTIISGISEVAKTAKIIEDSFNLHSAFNVDDWSKLSNHCNDFSISTSTSTSTINECSSYSPYIYNSNTTITNTTSDSIPNIPWNIISSDVNYSEKLNSLISDVDEIKEKMKKNEKENNKMNKFGLNFRFGKASPNEVHMSIYGPAFAAHDGWFAFDGNDYIDVSDFLIGEDNYCYMIPATEEQVNIGDFIFHGDGWCRVIDANSRTVTVEKIMTHEVVNILPTKNVFGFNFYTKLFMPFDVGTPSKDNPFGNILPFLAMSNGNSNDVLMMMMMMNGQKGFGFDTSNPMSMYLMMSMFNDKSNNDKDNLMMAMFMGQMDKTPHNCNYNCNCSNGDH